MRRDIIGSAQTDEIPPSLDRTGDLLVRLLIPNSCGVRSPQDEKLSEVEGKWHSRYDKH